MSRLTLVEGARLNLSEVTVVIAGGAELATNMLVSVFSAFGAHQPHRACSVDEAQELCRAQPVDLLVLDSTLGQEACEELTRWVRQQSDDNRLCPILFVTANPGVAQVGGARDVGVHYVVAKPIRPKVLFERLLWVVRENRAFVESETFLGPDRRRRSGSGPVGEGRRAEDARPDRRRS